MLGRVANQRDHDHADEQLGHPKRARRFLDGADQQLTDDRDGGRRHEEQQDPPSGLSSSRSRVAVCWSRYPVEGPVRAQRKYELAQ
jgi:hypothetical protein